MQKAFLHPRVLKVSTFLGTRKKRLEEVVLGIHVDKDRTFHLPVLVDEDFDINLKIDHFGEVKKNLNNLKYKLAFTDNGSDQVRIHGLIGVDIIQFMDMKTIPDQIICELPSVNCINAPGKLLIGQTQTVSESPKAKHDAYISVN